MSNKALTWAFAQSTGNPGRKAVLIALADMADEKHSCWPEQETLAAMTDQSPRSVRAHLAELERLELISRTHRYRDGKRTSDRYTLPVSVLASVHKPTALPANLASSQPADPAGSTPSLPAESVATTGKSRQVTQRNPQETPTVSQDAATTTATSKRKTGTRLSADWLRTTADREWQAGQAIPDEFAREATAEFKDHFLAAAGRNATKLDWSAAWRNWMRRAWRERHGETWRRAHGEPVKVVDFEAAREAAKLERQRARFASRDALASAR